MLLSQKDNGMTNSNSVQRRSILQSSARQAMLDRGLVPDFPPQALAELEMIIAEDGSLQELDLYQGIVSNHAKPACNGFAGWLENGW